MPEVDKDSMEILQQFIQTCVYKAIDERLANGWSTWRETVVSSFKEMKNNNEAAHKEIKDNEEKILEDLNEKYKSIDEKQQRLHISLEVLKTEMKIKSGIWGLVGGALPVAIALAVWFLKGLLEH